MNMTQQWIHLEASCASSGLNIRALAAETPEHFRQCNPIVLHQVAVVC